jgi:hypothetical protein
MTCELLQDIINLDVLIVQKIHKCLNPDPLPPGTPRLKPSAHECAAQEIARAGVPARVEKVTRREGREPHCPIAAGNAIFVGNVQGDAQLQVPILADEWVFIITLVFGNLFLLAVTTMVLRSQVPADQLLKVMRETLPDAEGWEGPAPVAHKLQQRGRGTAGRL